MYGYSQPQMRGRFVSQSWCICSSFPLLCSHVRESKLNQKWIILILIPFKKVDMNTASETIKKAIEISNRKRRKNNFSDFFWGSNVNDYTSGSYSNVITFNLHYFCRRDSRGTLLCGKSHDVRVSYLCPRPVHLCPH